MVRSDADIEYIENLSVQLKGTVTIKFTQTDD